ncbi:MBL fold metallo-hydrolase [Pyruvatibacter sp.]|uniref:MBL fold metallo-hydrolase n=1 Tax=Pyruvatibacter sp. TaxID=1981328 RepID=UPI0032EE9B36
MPLKIAIVPVTPLQQNCSLLWDDETMMGAICDPGGDIGRLTDAIAEAGFTLEKVLLTHGHLDHAGAAGELARTYNVPIEGPHRDDLFLLETLPEQAERYGMPQYDLFEPTRWLDQGDTVQVGGLTLDVIHCPGHTPGHIVFHHAPSRIALVGDVIFQGSVGRTDFPRGNPQQLVDSIRNRLFVLGDEIGFVPGHGPLSTFEHERKTNPYVSDQALGLG